ncbi:MAG: FHA domain-containing protein, partial [Gemmataceae bacterium]
MRARLTLETGDCHPAALDLTATQPATIGRSRDNTVVVKDDLASRLHAKIYTEDNRWFVRDFGLNGTRICGTKISGSAELIDGTTIQIGDTRLRFTILPQGTPLPSMSSADVTLTNNIRGLGSSSRIAMATIEKRGTVAVPSSNTTRTAETYHPIKAHSTSNSPPMPGTNSERALTESSNAPPDVASRLKVDELTALTRYMSTAMDTAD